jgi:hypothetical protein
MRGLETRRHAWLLAGAVLASLCALTKYFGLALLPLLAAWSLARERRLGPWALYLLLPVAILGAYEAYTAARYGGGLVQRAAGYSLLTRPGETRGLERGAISLVFAGGVVAPLLFGAPLALSRRMGLVAAGLALALCAASLLLDPLGALAFGPDGADANLILHVAFFSAAAAAAAALVAADLARRRDADALLLALWTLGTTVFGAWLNYTTNARALLPMAPALAIALVRGLDARRVPRLLRYAVLVPAAALALGVAWGDASLADAARRAARRIAVDHADDPGTHWFEGHWGFQLYLERAGWRPVDVRRSALRPGDLLASPLGWKLRLDVPAAAAEDLDVFGIRTAPVTTMALETATGFHAIQWGPLPYRFLPGHVERFEVRRLTEVVIFETDPDAVESRRQALERADAWLAALGRLGAGASTPCPPDFAAAAVDACRWCASPEECATCLADRAARRGATPECVERLGAELERAPTPQPRARPGR